jgi:hypothetical protein
VSLPQRVRVLLADDVRRILGFTDIRGTKVPNLVLAQQRVEEWQSERVPPRDSERGGSSSPVEVAERLEDRRVSTQAARDAVELPGLIDGFQAELVLAAYHRAPTPELAEVAERLAKVVTRCVRPVDHDGIDTTPECRSCARPGKVGKVLYAGHKNVTVWERVPNIRLCRWCYDIQSAEGILPPVNIVHTRHTLGARAAGLELAAWLRQRDARKKVRRAS